MWNYVGESGDFIKNKNNGQSIVATWQLTTINLQLQLIPKDLMTVAIAKNLATFNSSLVDSDNLSGLFIV